MTRRHLTIGIASITVIAVAALTGCSSSSSGAKTGNSSPVAASAKALVTSLSQTPTSIGVTTPVQGTVPRGKTMVYIAPAGTPSAQAQGVEQAGDLLGWNVSIVVQGPTPQDIQNVWDKLVIQKPDVIIAGGTPLQLISSQLDKLHAGGTKFITNSIAETQDTDPRVTANVFGQSLFAYFGKLMANWTVVDSGNKADTLVLNFPEFPTFPIIADSYKKELKSLCSDCSASSIDVASADVGTKIPTQIVTYLQAHPNVNYVYAENGFLLTGVPAALKGAGLANRVQLMSMFGDATINQSIKDGDIAIDLPQSGAWAGWYQVDAAVRAFAGQEQLPSMSDRFPTQFIGKAQETFDLETGWNPFPDLRGDFAKLWGISS